MPNLKDLKNRIASVKSTRKITKAMQMVAAAKLRRAQEAAEQSRPYTERFNAVMSRLAASVGGSDTAPKLLSGTGSDQVHLLVVMTAERGLCGGFNANIAKLAKAHARGLIAKGKEVKILTVGKKGRDSIRRDFGDLLVGHVDLSDVKRLGYADAQGIAKDVLGRFDAGEYDIATIFEVRERRQPDPDGTADHPGDLRRDRRRGRGDDTVRLRAQRRGHPGRPAAARRCNGDLLGSAGKRGL